MQQSTIKPRGWIAGVVAFTNLGYFWLNIITSKQLKPVRGKTPVYAIAHSLMSL